LLPSTHLTLLEPRPLKTKPPLWTEEQIDVYAKDPAYYSIARSLRPEEMGDYGDFGRYTMGSVVHHFQDDERAEPEAKAGQSHQIAIGCKPRTVAKYSGYSAAM
jgi:hypothetical protein